MSSDSITVELTPEAASLVRQAIDADGFATPGEVIEAALQDWSANRHRLGWSPREIAGLADEAVAGGSGIYASIDEIKREVVRRHALGDE